MEGRVQQNQIMAAPAKVMVTAKTFAAKFRSKREVFNFLSVDVGVYLPAYGKDSSAFHFM